jgi:hypothetical protein
LASVSITVHAGVTRIGPETAARPTPSVNLVPFQYIAKAYTELLGRAPAPSEWARAVQSFENGGCTTAVLIQLGDTIVESSEYRHDYPRSDVGSIALTLYRFVLNREPNEAEYVTMRNQLTGTPTTPQLTPTDTATSVYERPEFATLTQPTICSANDPSYYFGRPGDLTGYPAIATPSTGAPRPDTPGAALQQRLDTLSLFGGGVVDLTERRVVGLATIRDNHLSSGDRTHFDVILSSGTHQLVGSTVHRNCLLPNPGGRATCGGGRNANGAEWIANSSQGLPSWAQMGI